MCELCTVKRLVPDVTVPHDVNDMLAMLGSNFRVPPPDHQKLIEARERVYHAIMDQGPQPRHHLDTMKRHRREWPALWRALDELMQT